MKKLLKLGIAQAASSGIPIVMWLLISYVYNNQEYSNVFTLTYSFQFVFNLIYSVMVYGSLVYENNNKLETRDYSWSAILNSVLVLSVIAIFMMIRYDIVFDMLGVEIGNYLTFYTYSILAFIPNMIIAGVVAVLQFDGLEDKGYKVMIYYYILQCISILIIKMIYNRSSLSLCIMTSLIVCIVYSIIILKRFMHINKYRFNSLNGIKYRIVSIMSNICMYTIYSFGLKPVSSFSPLIFTTYNIMALCTDTQWDVLSTAIETNTTLHVCDGTYEKNKRKIMIDSILLSLILIVSSLIMVVISSFYYKLDLWYLIIIMVLEIGILPLYAIRYVVVEYMNIKHISIIITIIPLIGYTLRTIMSLSIKNIYGLSLSVFIASGLFVNLSSLGLYLILRNNKKQLIKI